MKNVAIALFLFLSAFSDAHADSVHVLPRSVNAVHFFTNSGIGPVDEQWVEVDATALGVPADATAIFLQGLLLITAGRQTEFCFSYFMVTPTKVYDWPNKIALRAPSNPQEVYPAFGIGESVVSHGAGVRQPFASWVPLENGKFFWLYTRSTHGHYPESCAYGANMVIQAYTR